MRKKTPITIFTQISSKLAIRLTGARSTAKPNKIAKKKPQISATIELKIDFNGTWAGFVKIKPAFRIFINNYAPIGYCPF